jgi:HSP20 family molecular chaperone IbpA
MATINATFETRREAELAVEHLVQEHGIDRDDVEVGAEGDQNSAGVEASGSDNETKLEDGTGDEAALNGRISLSVTVDGEETAEFVQGVLEEYGGDEITIEG